MPYANIWVDCLDCDHTFRLNERKMNSAMEVTCPQCDSIMLFVRVVSPKGKKSAVIKKKPTKKKWSIKEKGKIKKRIKKIRRTKK